MKISDVGIDLIKQFEGCRLQAYQPKGEDHKKYPLYTIGYGHYGVQKNLKITQSEADSLLRVDISKFEKKVEKYNAKYNFNQNEFDALVSFAFNVGSIDQLTQLGTRSKAEIAEKMLLYRKSGGIVLEGLVKRRKAEHDLFLRR